MRELLKRLERLESCAAGEGDELERVRRLGELFDQRVAYLLGPDVQRHIPGSDPEVNALLAKIREDIAQSK